MHVYMSVDRYPLAANLYIIINERVNYNLRRVIFYKELEHTKTSIPNAKLNSYKYMLLLRVVINIADMGTLN
jgi:hypothetical protein